MKKLEMRDMIKDQPFLKDMDSDYLDVLVGCASNMSFNKGHFLLTQNGNADHFYIINHGNVHIEMSAGDKGPVTIQTLSDGDILGWSWLIPPYKWRFDALVVEPTTVIAFDGEFLRKKCEENHSFGYDMLKRMTGVITYRLLFTRKDLMDFYI